MPYFACRGYVSQSEQYAAGKRLKKRARERAGTVTIFHLGDHDPSGIDMTRDNLDRLQMFSRGKVQVERLALNMDQVRQYSPPPNPAKTTDSRYLSYIQEYGYESWELDALDPTVLEELVRSAVDPLIYRDVWNETVGNENEDKAALQGVVDRWDDVRRFVRDEDDAERGTRGGVDMTHTYAVMHISKAAHERDHRQALGSRLPSGVRRRRQVRRRASRHARDRARGGNRRAASGRPSPARLAARLW